MASPGDDTEPRSVATLVGLPVVLLVLSATLAVYKTTLNPGLPIMLGAALAALVALYRFVRGAGPYYHWAIDVAALLLVWMAASAHSGLDSYLSERSLATFVGGIAFLWAPVCFISSQRDWQYSAHGIVLLTTLASLQAWPSAVRSAIETGSLPPLMGTFVNPDTFSVLPLLGLTLAIGLFERASPRTAAILSVEMGIMFLTMGATGCRSSLLGFAVGSAAFLGLLLANRGARHLRKAQSLLVLPLALALLAIPLTNFGFHVFGKYAATLEGEALTRETTRIEVATLGLKAAAARPVLGCGPGCFGLGFQTVRKPGHDTLFINIAHNDPMEMAVELGFPGLALWLLLIGSCLSKPYRLLRDGRRPLAAAGSLAAVLAVTVYSFFNFVISERPVFWAELLIFGLALSIPSTRLRYEEKKVVRFGACLAVLGLAFVAFQFGWRGVRADARLAESNFYREQLQLERAMQSLDSAIALQPNRATLRLERASLDEAWGAFQPDYDALSSRLYHLEAASKASPADLGVLTSYAQACLEKGDVERARQLLEQAQAYSPYEQNVRDRRAALAISQAQFAEALDLLILDPQSAARDNQIVALLVSLERESANSGAQALRPHLQDARQGAESLQILQSAVDECEKRGLWAEGLRLATLQMAFAEDDLCIVRRRAAFLGHIQGEGPEWAALNQALDKAPPSRDLCYGQLLERWTTLGWTLNKSLEVQKRLQSDLDVDPRISLARLALSELWRLQGHRKEAIDLIRKGLDFEARSVPLLRQLGRLYEESGSRDLALSYFSEASRAAPDDAQLKAKVEQLKKGTP